MAVAPLREAMIRQHVSHAFKAPPAPAAPKLGAGMSLKSLQRLMLARIPGLKSATMVPSAGTLQAMLRQPGTVKPAVAPIGQGMHGPLGGNFLTRQKGGAISLKG